MCAYRRSSTIRAEWRVLHVEDVEPANGSCGERLERGAVARDDDVVPTQCCRVTKPVRTPVDESGDVAGADAERLGEDPLRRRTTLL